jgi:hypothetical protein
VILFRKKNAAEDLLQLAQTSYQRQMAELQKFQDEEKKKKAELQQMYELLVKELEVKYEQDKKILTEEKKNRIKEIVDKYHGNTEELTNLLKKEFDL